MTQGDPEKSAVLIIDDDDQIRNLLKELLNVEYECSTVGSAEAALALISEKNFALVVSDINMEGISGLDLVPMILKQTPDTVVVMISGQATIDYAIDAMRAGAFDYVTKPLDFRRVDSAVRRALAHHQLLVDKRRHENHLEELVRERTAELEHLAYHDQLTDLPNRNLFADRCAQALATARRNKVRVGVMLVSLDRFKEITQTLGHGAADVILTEAAARFHHCVEEGDTIAHFDGDEFGLVLTQIAKSEYLAETCLAISAALRAPFHIDEHEVFVTTSIGISLFPDNGDDVAAILRNAGAALHRAKTKGGNDYQFYAAEMNAQAVKRFALEADMRHALEKEEFITHYQPIVNLSSGEVIGAEALVRWLHPEFGLLPPAHFIGLAEDTGLIMDIGELVMRTACRQTRIWQDRGFGQLGIAVNVSARHFQQKNFLLRLVEILRETELEPACLELELTETSIMESAESAIELLTQIRKLGVKVAIDDFGTGYSSLSYLKRLPIDTVKLDRSFVNGATTDPDDAALVMAIVTLAHNLRLRVIAEGIETGEQLAFLRLLRCDEGQGYFFGKPMAAEAFESTLATDPKSNLRLLSQSNRRNPKSLRSVVNE